MTKARPILVISLLLSCCGATVAEEAPVRLSASGKLEYSQNARGDRLIDFSHCGYQGSDQPIPKATPRVFVVPSGADDTARIQAAIDFVSRQPLGSDGLRGAVLLDQGEFQVSGQLKIVTSGVVLQGHGAGQGRTSLRATGHDRRALILIRPGPGRPDGKLPSAPTYFVVNEYVPAGSSRIQLDQTTGLAVGQRVRITHASSKAWIDQLGVQRLGWREGTRDIRWIRKITNVDGNEVHLDAPLTLGIDSRLTKANLERFDVRGLIKSVGVQDLSLVSDVERTHLRDEEHAWYGIHMQGVYDGWVQRVAFRHFAGGAVVLGDTTRRITVSDCASFHPVSELGGYRRQTFFTLGEQCLFLRCWSEQGLHDFSVGHCAAGPNAFVNCFAKDARGDSGPRESCAIGVLYDNVRIDGNDLNLMNRWNSPRKVGWSAIQCVLWQCQAANVRCEQPPIGDNWALGIWANPAGDGNFVGLSEFIRPISLFQQQLAERVGQEAAEQSGPFLLDPVGATNPNVEQAQQFAVQSDSAKKQLLDLIQESWHVQRLGADTPPLLEKLKRTTPKTKVALPPRKLALRSGWLVTGSDLLTGGHYTPRWWRGELPPERAAEMGRAITRFAPGRIGRGLTDDLELFAAEMVDDRIVGYDHHYGLWYDRRRDDHLMVRRKTGEVVPPFYEQPFARSGVGRAWDGLSRYDLTKFNHWYWHRLRRFCELGERHGFVLCHHQYFQHNILEAGAHWSDSPWRPANNINQTNFPEPPPYVGDKRIFLDQPFYDISQSSMRKQHRNYIRQCLDNFVGQSNVIQLTSAEFTGPLSFIQFWVDTVVQWERETGNQVILGLSCTKDVQDAILRDPSRSPHVDVIDIRYWTYTRDNELYAPLGGKHLSPRQHLRQWKPKSTSFDSIVRSIREYRTRYPNKAVTYFADLYCRAERDGWAILIGGGSMANAPTLPADLARAINRMRPSDRLILDDGLWCLADADREYLVYGEVEKPASIRLPHDGYEWVRVDVATGRQMGDFVSAAEQAIVCDRRSAIWIRSRSVR